MVVAWTGAILGVATEEGGDGGGWGLGWGGDWGGGRMWLAFSLVVDGAIPL